MKKKLTNTLFCGLLMASSASYATVITFDNTAPANDFQYYGINGTYTESGYTITATSTTELFTFDPDYNHDYPAQNGTDFLYGEKIFATNLVLSATNPFSLQSFYGAALANQPGRTINLTGLVSGGGTKTTSFDTTGPDTWSFISLTGWDNLTQVTFSASNAININLDSITVNQAVATAPSTAPEPSVFGLFFAGLLGLGWVKNRKRV